MPDIINLDNLEGTIMYEQIPLVYFRFEHDRLMESRLLCRDKKILPFEFNDFNVSSDSIRRFFFYRIVPETRISIHEELAKSPVKYYNPERIIRFQKGKCIDDNFWLDCADLDESE